MDNRYQDQHPATMESWDDFVREPLPRAPRSPRPPRKLMLLGALAALLTVTVVGVNVLVIHNAHTLAPPSASTTPSVRATFTLQSATPTPVPSSDPKDNGWTQVTPAGGDVKFSASSPLRGYLCGSECRTLSKGGDMRSNRRGG